MIELDDRKLVDKLNNRLVDKLVNKVNDRAR